MRMSLILTALLLGAVPAPPEKPKEESGPVEINFAPLPESGIGKYKIHIVAETRGGDKFKESYTADRAVPASNIRFLVERSFQSAGWKVQCSDEAKLLVEGYKNSPLKSLEVTTEGLTKEQTPIIKRVPAKEKW